MSMMDLLTLRYLHGPNSAMHQFAMAAPRFAFAAMLLRLRSWVRQLVFGVAFCGLFAAGASAQTSIGVSPGFNLLGNSTTDAIDVASTFGDATKFTTVWKWASNKWFFYTPAQADGGAAIAQAKGYGALSTINPGEGFWLNSKRSMTLALGGGNPIASAFFQGNLAHGFSLISTGDESTPAQFSTSISTSSTPPSPGVSPQGPVVSLWAWDAAQANWYFYAPSLDQNGTLSAYILARRYLDFSAIGGKLMPGTGFWVNVGANAAVGAAPPAVGIGEIAGIGGGLVIGDHRYNDSGADYDRLGEGPGAGAMSSDQAQLGEQAVVDLDAAGNATAVHIIPELIGVVSAIQTTPVAQLTVAGTIVRVNSDATAGPVTVYSGYAAFGDIKVNDRVEVHGSTQSDSSGATYVAATRIEQKPGMCNPSPCAARVAGSISALDTTGQSFTLGGLTVQYQGAVIFPANTPLQNGMRVSVLSTSALNGATLSASAINIRKLSSSVTSLTLSGRIANFVSNADFTVSGVGVDASAPSLAPANQNLANGRAVTVAGSFDPASNKLVATSLKTRDRIPMSVEVRGTITDFVSQSNFKVRGVPIDASNASFTNGTAASLANNVYVEIVGAIANQSLLATTVKFRTPEAGSMLEYAGTVSNFDATAGSFTLTSLNSSAQVNAQLAASPFYYGGTAAKMVNGATVVVFGSLANGTLTVIAVKFLLYPSIVGHRTGVDHPIEIGGIAHNIVVDGASVSFRLGALTVTFSGTVEGGTLTDGARVEVLGTVSNNSVAASRVYVELGNER